MTSHHDGHVDVTSHNISQSAEIAVSTVFHAHTICFMSDSYDISCDTLRHLATTGMGIDFRSIEHKTDELPELDQQC